MTKHKIAQLVRQANNASDHEKRQNLIDAIPKIVEPYYTIQNGVVTRSRRIIQYCLDEDGEVRKCYNDISHSSCTDIGKLLS